MGGGLVGCSGGHFGRNCSIAIWNAVQYGLRVPCQHCCSLWVEVISLSPCVAWVTDRRYWMCIGFNIAMKCSLSCLTILVFPRARLYNSTCLQFSVVYKFYHAHYSYDVTLIFATYIKTMSVLNLSCNIMLASISFRPLLFFFFFKFVIGSICCWVLQNAISLC